MSGNKNRNPVKPFKTKAQKGIDSLNQSFLVYCLTIVPLLNLYTLLDPAVYFKFAALAGGLLIYTLVFAYFQHMNNEGINYSVFKRWIILALLAYSVLSGLSIIPAINKSEAIYEFSKNILFLILFLVLITIFSNTIISRKFTSKVISIFSFVIILSGLFQFVSVKVHPFDYNILIKNVSAYFMNKNLFSQVLLLTLPFNVYGALVLTRKWKLFCTFNGLISILLIILLLSRAVWIAMLIATTATILLSLYNNSRGKKVGSFFNRQLKLMAIGVASIVIIAVSILFAVIDRNTSNNVINKLNIWEGSGNVRLVMWKNSINMFTDNPILGIGGGNWKIQASNYGLYKDLKINDKKQFQRPHNDYIWVLSEHGILGFISFAAISILGLFYLIKITIRTENENIRLYHYCLFFGIISYLAFSFFSYPKERITHNVYFFFFLATATADYQLLKKEKSIAVTKKSLFIIIPVILILCGILYVGIARLKGEQHARIAIDASMSGRFEYTINHINEAESFLYSIDPTSTPLKWYLGLGNFRKGNIEHALENFRDGLKTNPFHSHSYNSIGIIYAKRAEYEEAGNYFRKALEFRPFLTESIVNLARIEIQETQYNSAFSLLQRIDPDTDHVTYKNLIYKLLLDKIDSLAISLEDTFLVPYLNKVKESKPITFDLYRKSFKNKVNFEEQLLDYLAANIIQNIPDLSQERINKLSRYRMNANEE